MTNGFQEWKKKLSTRVLSQKLESKSFYERTDELELLPGGPDGITRRFYKREIDETKLEENIVYVL